MNIENSVKRISKARFHPEEFTKQNKFKGSFTWPSRSQGTRDKDQGLIIVQSVRENS